MVRIITVQFDYGQNTNYSTLLTVFEHSVKEHMPTAIIDIVQMKQAPEYINKSLPIGFTTNTKKLDCWVYLLEKAKPNERIILMDCDMLVIGNLEEAFDREEFDIGFTKRTNSIYPMNGGVVFVNVNERSIDFIKLWRKVNWKMFNDKKFHNPWRVKYAGMNQAAFGYIYENLQYSAIVKPFLCSEFNVCNEEWHCYPENAKCIHIKGPLRKVCLNYAFGHPIHGDIEKFKKPFELWKAQYDKIPKEVFNSQSTVKESIYYVIVYFDYEEKNTFESLANICEYSIKKNCKDATIIKCLLEEPKQDSTARTFLSNTVKLSKWYEIVLSLPEEAKIVLLDADTLVINDPKELFKENFDLAYTTRTNSSYPINSGVIFLKRNDMTLLFLQKWKEINDKMLYNPSFHAKWQIKYAGINQAAFGYLLENYSKPIKLLSVPCAKYNLCNEDWEYLDLKQSYIVHIKGQLRKALFEKTSLEQFKTFEKPFNLWNQYYDEYSLKKMACDC